MSDEGSAFIRLFGELIQSREGEVEENEANREERPVNPNPDENVEAEPQVGQNPQENVEADTQVNQNHQVNVEVEAQVTEDGQVNLQAETLINRNDQPQEIENVQADEEFSINIKYGKSHITNTHHFCII